MLKGEPGSLMERANDGCVVNAAKANLDCGWSAIETTTSGCLGFCLLLDWGVRGDLFCKKCPRDCGFYYKSPKQRLNLSRS